MIRLGKRAILRMSDKEYAELMEMRGHIFSAWSVTELLRKALVLLREEFVRRNGPELKGRVLTMPVNFGMSDSERSRLTKPVACQTSEVLSVSDVIESADRQDGAQAALDVTSPIERIDPKPAVSDVPERVRQTTAKRPPKKASKVKVSDKTPSPAKSKKGKGKHA